MHAKGARIEKYTNKSTQRKIYRQTIASQKGTKLQPKQIDE